MKKRWREAIGSFFLAGTLAMSAPALAEEETASFLKTERIHESLPEMTFTVTDTGKRLENTLRENILQVTIRTEDGNVLQKIEYASAEHPKNDYAAAFIKLEDMNFDGFLDMNLLTAQGARNVFTALSVYNPDKGKFEEVLKGWNFHQQERRFGSGEEQLELCNYELFPEQLAVYSAVQDGYRYAYDVVYGWEGRYFLVPDVLAEVYDAGENRIGERLELYGTGTIRCWDEQYPEEWYYGQQNVARERRESMRKLMLDHGTTDPVYAKVAHVDWVNLRQQDSKESPSLTRLNAGETVQVLAEGLGTDEGWVRVWYMPEGKGIFVSEPDDGSSGLTGYIWHSFLERME